MSYVRKLWLRRKFDRLLDRILDARKSGEEPLELQQTAYNILLELNAMEMRK